MHDSDCLWVIIEIYARLDGSIRGTMAANFNQLHVNITSAQ